jgi:hypothetical protein
MAVAERSTVKHEVSAGRSTARDEDGLIEFEEPSGAPAVTSRSKSVMKLGCTALPDAAAGFGKKHAKGRRARPLPPNASWRPYRHEP